MKNVFRTLRLCAFAGKIFFLSACALPIRSEDIPGVLAGMAGDHASACLIAGASGGAGAMAVTPAPIPGGGWGSANFIFCRSNEAGSKIEASAAGVKIEHGSTSSSRAAIDALTDRLDTLESAIKYLLQKLLESAKPGTPL